MRYFIVLVGLLIALSVNAAEFKNGYVSGEGYTYNDGYWYYSDQPHIRTQYQNAGYWSCGRYYTGSLFWKYTPVIFRDKKVVAKKAATPPPTPSYSDPEWRRKLLDIAAFRDRQEAKIRAGAFEQQYFLEGVNALGLGGNFRWNGYGTVPPYAIPSNAPTYMPNAVSGYSTTTNFGANANTAYGYSYNTIAQLYGDTNLNQLYLQAGQLTANAQKLAGDGHTNFQALVGAEGANRARVAEILARGQMAFQVITALNGPGSIETKGFSFKFSSTGDVTRTDTDVKPEVKADLLKQWQALAANKCASCHNATTKKGGFDVSLYPAMTMPQKQAVWKVITTADDSKVMPKPKAGDKPTRLTTDEQRLFFLN